ncbi:unnamed protein product [Echinostoma caproni]|uniref:Conserved oligomeric Golgi complex subunit 4 n=1 Tax=Echinostoma caproni TaxID=27848 RepID=A0A183BAJ8_9TREM|nr:unnamed protein product [Echinostoma caproni]
MVSQASELALELSGKIRQLDLVKNRVLECVSKLDDIINLKQCASNAEVAFREERYEEAAGYVNTFLKTKKNVIELTEKITSDTQTRNSVGILDKCREQLAVIAEQRFDQAAKMRDTAVIERFCKIFPLIGKHEDGLKRFGDYLCVTIRQKCNGLISLAEVSDGKEQTTVCLNLLTEIFEFIAETVGDNQVYVETYFGKWSCGFDCCRFFLGLPRNPHPKILARKPDLQNSRTELRVHSPLGAGVQSSDQTLSGWGHKSKVSNSLRCTMEPVTTATTRKVCVCAVRTPLLGWFGMMVFGQLS